MLWNDSAQHLSCLLGHSRKDGYCQEFLNVLKEKYNGNWKTMEVMTNTQQIQVLIWFTVNLVSFHSCADIANATISNIFQRNTKEINLRNSMIIIIIFLK